MARIYFTLILILLAGFSYGQYFYNPSFEGPNPLPNNPPPNWENCDGTPDTQPYVWDVPTLPSDGDSYVGMAWLSSWTEKIWTPLANSLKADSCYLIQIDLAYYDEINYYGDVQPCIPINIQVMGSTYFCSEGTVLWQSPYIGHSYWDTYEFLLEPEEGINNIMLKTVYDQTIPWGSIGYILIDNIKVVTPPDLDLGNDTTICNNDSILLDPGSGFNEYIWQDGSNDSIYYATQAGTYYVEGITYWGCSRYDTIVIEQSPQIELGEDTTICIGDTILLSPGAGYEQYLWFNGSTDSTLQLWDVGQYLVWVYVTDSIGCTAVDSLHLSIINDSTTVDIGPDTLICDGTGYTLNPGEYQEYLWQDSATTSIFIVTEPGLYWVQVLGDCGYASDTVIIDLFPEIELDLGNDTLVCDDIILPLNAGSGFESYLWQDGSSEQTFEVNGTGYYWVTVMDDNGCFKTDTIHVALSDAVVVTLGNDTTVCTNEQFVLSPGDEFTTYVWQDGSTEPVYPVNIPGTYWVEVTDIIGCSGADTINVGLNPSPEVFLGNDTTVCTGSIFTLDPGSQYTSYLWQDNSNLPVYSVSTPGFYSVTVSNTYNCLATDEIFVDFGSPEIELGPNSILCLGDTIFLDPGQGYNSYLWQDSTTNSVYPAINGGMYIVEVTDIYGCTSEDAVELEPIPKPVADLGGDQPICIGESLILETPQGPFLYMWNGEPGGTFKEIYSGGTYSVEVSNQCGVATDQVVVTEFPIPDVNLGEDGMLQAGETIELDAGGSYESYLWQDGSTNRYFVLTFENASAEDPFYYVEVTDGPCKNSDTTKITLLKVKIPNVFTPNSDGLNDTFSPMDGSWSGVNNHHMEVFNRWGEKVWESDNFEEGWDGRRNGRFVSDGTYYWVLDIYYGDDNVAQRLKGTVSILGVNE